MIQKNIELFEALRKLHLPLGQYAVIGSGPLGIRNLREINDIDIIVSDTLKTKLEEKYGVIDDGSTKKIIFPGVDIEAFWECSFYSQPKKNGFTMAETIFQADIIDGLPFQSLEEVIHFKKRMNREKDRKDILLIEEWIKKNLG